MPHTYERKFRVRMYECDAFGHVNNANYLRYMQEAAIEASSDAGYSPRRYNELGQHWLIRESEIDYFTPLFYGDELIVKTWVLDFRRVRSRRLYEFRRNGGDELIARGATDWIYLDQQTLRPVEIPAPMRAAFFPEGEPAPAPPRQPFPPAPPPPAGVHIMRRRAEWRDIDPAGHVNNAVYLAYIEEAGIDVARAGGWHMPRMMEHGFGIVARSQRIEYHQPAQMGQEIQIETWLSPPRNTSAVRHYLIKRAETGELLARARTVWVWVELATGRPMRVPDYFVRDFQPNISTEA
jgi:acyl-CoA thioester hydrolase